MEPTKKHGVPVKHIKKIEVKPPVQENARRPDAKAETLPSEMKPRGSCKVISAGV